MKFYPLFMDLEERHILLVGAGEVGLRKLRGILECSPASVLVVDPATPREDALSLLMKEPVLFCRRAVQEDDFNGISLVFASTPHHDVNAFISTVCKSRGILCNIADAPGKSDFIVPAHFWRGDICLCLSTGGASPALAKKLRSDMEEWFDGHYALLALLLKRLRPLLLSLNMPTRENSAIFRSLVHSDLGTMLATKNREGAIAILACNLPVALHTNIGDLLHEL